MISNFPGGSFYVSLLFPNLTPFVYGYTDLSREYAVKVKVKHKRILFLKTRDYAIVKQKNIAE
jgi:hypothetical protein